MQSPRSSSAASAPPASPGAPRPADPARDAAYRHLAKVAARLPDLDPLPFSDQHLSPRDAAFAHAIVHAGLQRWLTLSWIIGAYLNRPFPDLEPGLRGALIGGAAQILLLDKVPTHAAINETVEWAKATIRPGAGGMANAVLRKVANLLTAGDQPRRPWADRRDELLLPDGTARPLSQEVLPADAGQRLAVATSHPQPLVEAWHLRFGEQTARRLLLHSLCSPPTVLFTAAAANPPDGLAAHQSPNHRVFTGSRAELQTLLEVRPELWVQDAASSIAVDSVADLKPRLVLDLCAGQGTKTRQLAFRFPSARIIATDTDAGRLSTLRRTFARSDRVEVVTPGDVQGRAAAGADLILLDVPCSNTGVLARRTEAKYRWSPRMFDRLGKIQRSILAAAAPLLAPGGRILYSTCSLEPDENEGPVEWATTALGLRLVSARLVLPEAIPGETANRYRDGSFHALLDRP